MASSNGTFKTFIYAIAMLSIAGFCSLSIAGYFNLDGKVVNAKEVNEAQHKELAQGSIKRDASQGQEIEHIKEIVTDIRLEQRTMKSDLQHFYKRVESKL